MELPSGLATPKIALNGQAQMEHDKPSVEENASISSQQKPKSGWRKFRSAWVLLIRIKA